MNTDKLVNGNKILTFAQLQWCLTMISKHTFINFSCYVIELADDTKEVLKLQVKPEGWFRVVKPWWWLKVLPYMTAYKRAPYEKIFKIELLQCWKVCSWQFFCGAGQWYITVCCYNKVIKYARLKPRLIKNNFSHKKINLD